MSNDTTMSSGHWKLYLTALLASMAAVRGDPDTTNLPFHELSRRTLTNPTKNNASWFGYSIAHQKKINSLIIGSPREDAFGQVYLCPLSKGDKSCTTLSHEITTKDKTFANNNKHTFWFGATVNAGESFIMACAPRNTIQVYTSFHSTKGQCYYAEVSDLSKPMQSAHQVSNNDLSKYQYKAYPKQDNNIRLKGEKLSDTFGLSTYLSSKRTYVGGSAISIGRVIVYDDIAKKPKLINVENDGLNQNSVSFNFGYSITSGNFTAKEEWIAISTPYGTIGYGRVYFYTEPANASYANTAINVWVTGEGHTTDLGSLFGASLASLKMENGTSALLVGAPAYSTLGYDVGAVYIYIFMEKEYKFDLIKKLLPSEITFGGHFGASIVCVSDFDGDNIQEVAIAAPFENSGKGAVYIYSGKQLLVKDPGSRGSRVPWLQKLEPKEELRIVTRFAPYYGLSLASLEDADENGCSGLAVGAPGVSSVTLYHCIASVKVSFKHDFSNITYVAKKLNKNDTFTISTCLLVEKNKGKPDNIDTNVTLSFKITHPDVRLESSKNNTVQITTRLQPPEMCQNLKILLPQEADYDQPIKLDMSVTLEQNPLVSSNFNSGLVLLNHGISYSKQVTVPLQLGSNLNFDVTTSIKDGYVIGSSEHETLNIFIQNYGSTAHSPCVSVGLSGLTVSTTPKGYLCSVVNGAVTCTIPMRKGGHNKGPWSYNITLSMKSLTSSNEKLEFSSRIFTSNCSIDINRNNTKTIKLKPDSNIKITNSVLYVKVTREELDTKGRPVDHYYKIINDGVTVWKNLVCEVSLPHQVKIEKVSIKSEICIIEGHTAFCHIAELRNKAETSVRIHMKIKPGSPFADKIKMGKATVDTKLRLKLTDTKNVTYEITTIVSLWEAPTVPLWMIIVASLIGILIIIVLFWALNECGCMKRQNKEKLKELKKDLYRQSVRRSMMLRQSHIEVIPNNGNNEERQRLIDVSEGDAVSHDGELQHAQSAQPANDINAEQAIDLEKENQTKEVAPQTKDMVNGQHTNITVNAQQAKDIINEKQANEVNGQKIKDMVNAQVAQLAKVMVNAQHNKDTISVQQDEDEVNIQQAKDLIDADIGNMANAKPVKAIHHDDKDPARLALNAELAKALSKGTKKVVTQAEIH